MSDSDLVAQAVAELYWAEPGDFTPRRTALAAQARKGGDSAGAKAIAVLRKPTKAAYVVNRLFRSDQRVAVQLGDLGEELRKAQRSADAHHMRKLTGTRKELIEALTDQAFEVAHEESPSPALRVEVASTLKAALADAEVTTLLNHGTLLKSVEWDGFGFPSAPELSVIVPTATTRDDAPVPGRPTTESKEPTKPKETAAKLDRGHSERKTREAERAKAAAKARREKEVTAAKERQREEKARAAAVAKAGKVLDAATKVESELKDKVRRLRDELDTARQDLEKSKETVRRAGIAHRRAAQSLRVVPDADS